MTIMTYWVEVEFLPTAPDIHGALHRFPLQLPLRERRRHIRNIQLGGGLRQACGCVLVYGLYTMKDHHLQCYTVLAYLSTHSYVVAPSNPLSLSAIQ